MWFEILPSFGIITLALAAPTYATYGINKLVLGNAFRRNMDERWERSMFQRDRRITGDAYESNGLETIPDEQK